MRNDIRDLDIAANVGLEHRIGFGVSEDAFQPVFGIADADVIAPLLDLLRGEAGLLPGEDGKGYVVHRQSS